MPRPIASVLPVTLVAALALAACQPREDPAVSPVDPDTIAAAQDTVAAPTGTEDELGAAADAYATLEPVGTTDARGVVRLSRTQTGVTAFAELGGFDERTHYIDLLDLRSCDGIQDRPDARLLQRLGEVDVLDDGTGRIETQIPGVTLDGDRSAMGRAIAVRHQDGSAAACGVVGPAVR